MTKYLDPSWKPSESIVESAKRQGYTSDEIKRRHIQWKQRMIDFAQKKDVRGQLQCDNWNAQWFRMITSEEPEGAEENRKPKPKRYNAASDPEHNAQLDEKLDKIYATKSPNSNDRLKQLRDMAGNNRS